MEGFVEPSAIADQFEQFAKANGTRQPLPGVIQPRGLFDPTWHDFSGYYDPAGVRRRALYTMNFAVLREVAQKVAVVGAIHNTRLSQVRPFTQHVFDDEETGFRIKLKDPKATPTPQQEKAMRQIGEFFAHTGFTDFKGAEKRKDRFPQFVDKAVRECMTIDQNALSLQRDRAGRLIAFHTLDGATIHPVLRTRPYLDDESITFVQKINERVVETFTDTDIIFHFMNCRADIINNAFGYAPLEQAIDTVTGWLFSMAYNKEFFNTGAQPKGFFSFSPKQPIDPKAMVELQRQWVAMFRGVRGMWRVPFLQYDAKWQNLAPSNRDMEFNQYVQFLSALICALYKIDPSELGLKFSQSATISVGGQGGTDKQSKISHDRGLQDLLTYIKDLCNRIMEHQVGWEEYEFNFCGTEVKDESQEIDKDRKKVETYLTLNEVRAEHDKEPVPHGDVVLNPQYIQYIQSKEGMEAMGGMGGGMPGGAPEEPASEDELGGLLAGMSGPEMDEAVSGGLSSVFKSRQIPPVSITKEKDGRLHVQVGV